jgi:hypothetical protein
MGFPECVEANSLLKKSLPGWLADQKRIQHCQTKPKTLRKRVFKSLIRAPRWH